MSCTFFIRKASVSTNYWQISLQSGGLRRLPICWTVEETALVLNKREDLNLQIFSRFDFVRIPTTFFWNSSELSIF